MLALALALGSISAGSQTVTRTNNAVIVVSDNTTNDHAGTRSVELRFPQGTKVATVRAVLNGHDVSARFGNSSCVGGVCLSAQLTAADGLEDGKNILYATGKNENGTASSSRIRFEGHARATHAASVTAVSALASRAMGVAASSLAGSALPTGSTFLPPTIAMNGGSEPQSADQIWFNVGTQQTILTPSCSSTSIEYSVAFLDRRTLVPKTGGNDTAQCFSSWQALHSFLPV